MINTNRALAILLLLLISFSACQDDNLGDFNPILTAKDERDLGNALVARMKANTAINGYVPLSRTDYPEAYEYIDLAMTMVLIQTEIRDKFNWEVIILDDDSTFNAFSLPGGKIFITTGFLKFLTGEHQLIAILAHEAYYLDRLDQTGWQYLSHTMQVLRERYGSDEGTQYFTQILDNGTDRESNADAILEDINTLAYECEDVELADEFSMNMMCENYLYTLEGLEQLIDSVRESLLYDFEWLNIRPPGAPTPDSVVVEECFHEERTSKLENIRMACIIGDTISTPPIVHQAPYADFLDYLP